MSLSARAGGRSGWSSNVTMGSVTRCALRASRAEATASEASRRRDSSLEICSRELRRSEETPDVGAVMVALRREVVELALLGLSELFDVVGATTLDMDGTDDKFGV